MYRTQDGRPVRQASFGPARPLATKVAPAGLVLVLAALTIFSVVSAVLTSRASDEARREATLSRLFATAERSLLEQEILEHDLFLEGGVGREELDAQAARVRADLLAVRPVGPHAGVVDEALALHEEYLRRLPGALDEVERDPASAEEVEEEVLGPVFTELKDLLRREVAEHRAFTQQTLSELHSLQRVVLVATPVVFGLGLLLLALFAAILREHRREIDAQAEENRHQALHDSLTGLPNRAALRVRTDAALAEARLTGDPLVLMLIDLDRFKEINDTLGHHYGDVVLQAVSQRLQEVLRDGDTVARLGGDEFAVLLPAAGGLASALDLAARLRAAVGASIEADGVVLDVDASIGVVLSGEHGDDVDVLVQHADIAMYVAKERGHGICVYDADLDEHSPERLGLLGELRRAIDGDELLLHFQPKVGMPDDEVCGVEALVRWLHPERGLVQPGDFIPVAERTALIRPLTRWVIDAALAQVRHWQDSGRTLRVAVNVSARNLLDEGFVDEVVELLARWDVPASSLELEVTESAIMADPERAQRILERFAALGFTLSIDDFGAGYTSLAHLKKLPVHQLKIDRSFVSQMVTDRSDAVIVQSVVELGRNLGLTTVAEGVEDRETWDQLAELGCDVAQGYFLSRPLPAEALEAWFDAARAGLRV